MRKNIIIIPFLVTSICLFFLFAAGCGKKEDSPKKSDLIAKKAIPKTNKIPDSKASPKDKKEAEKKVPEVQAGKQEDVVTEAGKSEALAVAPEQAGKQEDVVTEAGKSEALAVAPDQYIPTGKIDPFAPSFNEEQVVAADKPTKKRRRGLLTPLEKLDLSQLKLLGVILAPSGNRAMVSELNGKGYVVTVGTYMGISSGRIIEILQDRIIVEEEVENILGKISLRKRELKLQKPAGE